MQKRSLPSATALAAVWTLTSWTAGCGDGSAQVGVHRVIGVYGVGGTVEVQQAFCTLLVEGGPESSGEPAASGPSESYYASAGTISLQYEPGCEVVGPSCVGFEVELSVEDFGEGSALRGRILDVGSPYVVYIWGEHDCDGPPSEVPAWVIEEAEDL